MKKRILLIIIFFMVGLVVIFTMPLPKGDKWTTSLINGYVIKKESDTNIKIGVLEDSKFISKIDDYIAEYSYGKRYILLKCIDNSTDDLIIKFYIIDSTSDLIYGPYFDYQTFTDKQEEIIDEEIVDYVKTINRE